MREYIIALIPPDTVANHAIACSRALRKRRSFYVLNRTSERAHVSLYHLTLPPGKLRRAIASLTRAVALIARPQLVASAFHQSEGWIGVEYQRSRALLALQRAVIAAVNPLRRGYLRDKDHLRLQNADPTVRRNILRYGYRSVGRSFRPHLTLTRLRSARPVPLSFDGRRDARFSFRAGALGIFTAGEHGTCVRLIKKFPFRSRVGGA